MARSYVLRKVLDREGHEHNQICSATLSEYLEGEARDVVVRSEHLNPAYVEWVAKRAHR